MIKEENVAVKVDKALHEAYRLLEESIRNVNENCSATESEDYRHRVGKVFYAMIFDLWEPLYKEHPNLKPADWDGDTISGTD